MRFDIRSKDRLGITQEILEVFSRQNWNLVTMEMHLHHTFVELDDTATLEDLKSVVLSVEGVTEVVEVDLLPGERRSQHLDAVLSKLQDPILDIDHLGKILLSNTAAATLLGLPREQLQGMEITEFTDYPLSSLLQKSPTTLDITLAGQSFLAAITPVFSYNRGIKQVSGAVLFLQSIRRIGQQIAAVTHAPGDNTTSLIGTSRSTRELISHTQRFSQLDMPVLIQGETGTGKELLAHMLHENGARSQAPFMAINCAALPENLLESELFGYAPGAFSGASKNGKPGLFELADGGSVFLDEIGEMSPYLQAKLLRVLQEYSFRRIGGEKEISVNVRIISATHRDLLAMAEEHQFREDLFYRLNVLNLSVPPLRERTEDIPELTRYFIQHAAEQTNRPAPDVSEAAMEMLLNYSWPGNIRELQNILFRAVAMSDDTYIDAKQLPFDSSSEHAEPKGVLKIGNWEDAISEFESQLLTSLFPHFPSSRKLANRLGVSHNTIALKLRKYGISK